MNETLVNATVNATALISTPFEETFIQLGLFLVVGCAILYVGWQVLKFLLRLSWIEERVQSLNDVDHQTKYTNLSNRIGDLDTKYSGLHNEIAELKSDCSQFNDSVTEIDMRVEVLEGKLLDILSKVPSIRNVVTTATDDEIVTKLIQRYGTNVKTIRDLRDELHCGTTKATRLVALWRTQLNAIQTGVPTNEQAEDM